MKVIKLYQHELQYINQYMRQVYPMGNLLRRTPRMVGIVCHILAHHDFHWGTKTYTLLHSHLIKFTIHNFKTTITNLNAKL